MNGKCLRQHCGVRINTILALYLFQSCVQLMQKAQHEDVSARATFGCNLAATVQLRCNSRILLNGQAFSSAVGGGSRGGVVGIQACIRILFMFKCFWIILFKYQNILCYLNIHCFIYYTVQFNFLVFVFWLEGFFFLYGEQDLPGDSFFFSLLHVQKKKEEEDACRAPQTCRLEIELNLRCSLQLAFTSSFRPHALVALSCSLALWPFLSRSLQLSLSGRVRGPLCANSLSRRESERQRWQDQ